MDIIGNIVRTDLHSYLEAAGAVDSRLPECIDVEEKWEEIAKAYMPDGIREFNSAPVAALGWMMFIGMAVAEFWDEDWEKYRVDNSIYEHLRDSRGYDYMDEYILEEVLHLDPKKAARVSSIVAECASRSNSILIRQQIEPGTTAAFNAFVSVIHQMYLMGMAMQLKSLGYKMTLMTV